MTWRVRLSAWLTKRERELVLSLLLFAISAGAVYAILLGSRVRYYDELEYLNLAYTLVHAHTFSFDGFHATAARPPGYPAFLALGMLLYDSYVFLRFMNIFLYVATLYLSNRIVRDRYGTIAGLVTLSFGMVYAVEFYSASTFYPQTLAGFLLVSSIRTWNLHEPDRWEWVVARGFVFGWLVLTVPITAPLLLLVFFWTLMRDGVRKQLRMVATAAMALVPVLAWGLRCQLALGAFVFCSTNGGYNLLLGNNLDAQVNFAQAGGWSSIREGGMLPEVQQDEFYRQRAVAYITDHSFEAAGRYARKVINYFNYTNRLVTSAESGSLRDILMFVTYYPMLGLFGYRLWLSRTVPLSRFESLLSFTYIASAFVVAVFFVRIRFRLPFDLLLIMIAAIQLTRLIGLESKGSR